MGWVKNASLFFHNKNEVELEIEAESYPALKYQKKGDLYFAENEGYVSFYSWNGEQGGGFGGSRIPIVMEDGSQVTLLGPWSSRPGVMNAAGFKPCVSVRIRGKYLCGGAITVSLAQFLLDAYKLPYHLEEVEDKSDGDIKYHLRKNV